ncbi:TetR family transcriptional regulator [Magnetospira thiophila]
MPRPSDSPDKLIDDALALAARDGWSAVSFHALASSSGRTLAQIREHFASREDLLRTFVRRTDRRVLAQGNGEGETVHDRLFDILMRRFEVLTAHKEGLRAVLRDLGRDPLSSLLLAPTFAQSMGWMLEAAGLSSQGWKGRLRTKALCALWLSTARVWLNDDSADQSATLAALDRNLQRLDVLASWCPWENNGAPSGDLSREVPT